MLPIARRNAHLVFAVIQSGLTSGVASAVASIPAFSSGHFLRSWLGAWLLAWLLMLPVVTLAAPFIRALSVAMTREEGERPG